MTTPLPAHVPVVVVGAGPTGMAAAIELGSRGIECLVVDRWDEVYPQPRAVHLDDEVHRIVARLGVGSEFTSISRPAAGLRLVDQRLRVLGQFDRGGHSDVNGYPRANMFDQPALEQLLRARLLELPSVSFQGGVQVVGLEQTSPGTVVVRTHDVRSGTEEHVEAEVVLGCDGANSVVRSSIGASLDDLGFEQRWLVIDVATALDLDQWDGVQQVCDSTRAATFMRIGTTRYRWEFQLVDGEAAADFESIEQVLPLLAPWTGAAAASDLDLLRTAEYTFRAALADRWRSGRAFLLGDAAHLTPPFIGQGMGAGLRDASNLAWKVAGFLSGQLSVDVLDTYQAERSAHARSMIEMARRVGVIMTGGGRLGDVVRRGLVPTLSRVPGVRAQLKDSSTPALPSSALISSRRSDRLAGHLCPNVRDDGSPLDPSLGAGWSLVTTSTPSPSDVDTLARHDCTVVRTSPDGRLGTWLHRHQAAAALVRPDRTVMASASDVSTLCTMAVNTIAPRAGDSGRHVPIVTVTA